jgi:hypothetical protein
MREPVSTTSACLLLVLSALPNPAVAARLRPEAARSYDQYVQRTEERMRAEVQDDDTFLWVYGLPTTRRRQALERLGQGEVVIERLQAKPAVGPVSTPGAMIHHWVGTILIPGATLTSVLRVVQNYNGQQQYFRPEVTRSRMLQHHGDDFIVYLRLKRAKIVTAVFDTEHEIRYHRPDATHAYSESRSTRIAELEDPGEADERALPAGDDHGFLWRLNSYWRFVETGEGVYVQCEAVSLTRDIPAGLGWLVQSFVNAIPKESLNFTLQSTRAAVYRTSR